MVVQVKVLKNADEIKEAQSKNARFAQLRDAQISKKAKDRVTVPEDVDVPEQDIDFSDILLDIQDITRARINEIDMISIIHLGQEMQIVNTPEVWEQLKVRFQ